MPMMLAVNMMLCLFILCVFGVLDKPLRYFSLRPAAGSLLCLLTTGLLLLENIAITDALLANPGGFFMPMIFAIVLCVTARRGTRRYLMAMSVFIGMGAWMFNQITYQMLEAISEYGDIIQGAFCLLFANLLEYEIKPVLMISLIGFQLCDVMSYVITIAGGQSAYLILGDGTKAVVTIGMLVSAVFIGRLREKIKQLWLKYAKKRSAPRAQPETT